MSPESIFCTVCDHNIVTGTACDGQPEECPYHTGPNRKVARNINNYAATVDRMIGSSDVAVVKGID
jgi:hypothetical protein